MKNYLSLIEADPAVMAGKPFLKGTRVTAEQILDKLASGETISAILNAYPQISRGQVLAVLSLAADVLKQANSAELQRLFYSSVEPSHHSQEEHLEYF